MYKPIIEIVTQQMHSQWESSVDGLILKQIGEIGVTVDKDELLKALQYDRDQYNAGFADGRRVAAPKWISVKDKLPGQFVSVLGYMTDAEVLPPVRECYLVGNMFVFPALMQVRPVSHWMPLPEPPKEGE